MADDDVKALLRQVLDILPTLATKADVAAVDARVAAVETRVAAVETQMVAVGTQVSMAEARAIARMDEFKAEIRGEFRTVNARLDEQGRVLVAMIPTHIAAVPSRSAAK